MTDLQTTVTAVTVYPDRARVTRSGVATLQPGVQRLEMRELPLALDPSSVRAAARGTARVRLLGVDVRREFFVETPAERVRELEKRIEGLQDQIAALDAQAGLLNEERKALLGLSGAAEAFAKGLAYGRTTAADQMALQATLRQRLGEIDAALQGLAVQRRELERQKQKLEAELTQLRGATGRERYVASVEVEVLQAGELTVELIGVVTHAGWTPLYDLRLLEGEQTTLEVGYLAQVTQRTGEDWSDVALTLSTARPALAQTIPELKPWTIAPPPPPMPMAAAPRGVTRAKMAAAPAPAMLEMAADFAGAAPEAAPVEEAEEVMATVETSGAAVTYTVPGAVSVPADGAPHKVTVARYALSPELDYVSAPKLVEAAYRRAKVANDSSYTLLPGPANLFAGDEFIGATRLELTAPGGKLELYLGVDDRVKVKRELKRREVDKKLIGDRRRITYGYEIALENFLAGPVTLTLYDQVPVAGHESIKVRLESVDPRPVEQTEMGLLKWELTLAAGQKHTVRFDFSVEHPRDMTVVGL